MNNDLILLLGDSITAGFDTAKHLPGFNILNKGVPADSTDECYNRITKELFESQPDKIFICIGTNDFAKDRNDEYILQNINKIVSKIRDYSHDAKIFLTSIFPTRSNDLRPNERINAFNKKLKQLTIDLDCSYFDIHNFFEDSEGKLKEIYTDDGLHLTVNAYQKWAKILSEFLSKES